MVAIYVLKLKSGKYYVGMTRKNIQRVLDHIDGKGASWTKKYPPSDSKPIISFQENMKESDENRVTLETMAKYGVRNVRGGDWCKVRMTQGEITQLEKKISNISKSPRKKSPSKKTSTYTRKTKAKKTKANPKPKKKGRKTPNYDVICARCNRVGHESKDCRAKTKVNPTGPLADLMRKGKPKR